MTTPNQIAVRHAKKFWDKVIKGNLEQDGVEKAFQAAIEEATVQRHFQYYRECKKSELFSIELLTQPSIHVRPVEVDEIPEVKELLQDRWHPASEPPTPKDFEPTGYIQTVNPVDHIDRVAWAVRPDDYTFTHYWRKITPPK